MWIRVGDLPLNRDHCGVVRCSSHWETSQEYFELLNLAGYQAQAPHVPRAITFKAPSRATVGVCTAKKLFLL